MKFEGEERVENFVLNVLLSEAPATNIPNATIQGILVLLL